MASILIAMASNLEIFRVTRKRYGDSARRPSPELQAQDCAQRAEQVNRVDVRLIASTFSQGEATYKSNGSFTTVQCSLCFDAGVETSSDIFRTSYSRSSTALLRPL